MRVLYVRLRPQHQDHVWSCDFIFSRTGDGRPVRMLTLIDEFTPECLAIAVSRRLISEGLSDPFIQRDTPDDIRSDNGPEFAAHRVRGWLENTGVTMLVIDLGSP